MVQHILSVRDLGQERIWQTILNQPYAVDTCPPHSTCSVCSVGLYCATPAEEDTTSFTTSITELGSTVCPITPENHDTQGIENIFNNKPLHCLIVQGVLPPDIHTLTEHSPCPILNGGNQLGHPCAALADMQLFSTLHPELDTLRIAWIGGVNGLAHALIELAMYVPFELFIALPQWSEPNNHILGLALKAGAKIFLTREPPLALDNAHIVYMGANPQNNAQMPLQAGLRLMPEDMQHAHPQARVVAGAHYSASYGVGQALLDDALQTLRWQHRNQVQKRLLTLLLSPQTETV